MFFGRQKELQELKALLAIPTAHLVTVQGRRRIGKSALIREFGKNFARYYEFTALPPFPKVPDAEQRVFFLKQMRNHGLGEPADQSWEGLFSHLAKKTVRMQALILFDEISWMAADAPLFQAKLKAIWDLEFKKNNKIFLVLCASASSWISENILSSTAFVGRIDLQLVVRELPIHECNKFWGKNRISELEKIKMLAVVGGIPRYLESVNHKETAERNIQHLAFRESGILNIDFQKIFNDLFGARATTYRQILECIVMGARSLPQICTTLKITKSGVIQKYMTDLEVSGFIARDFAWSLENGKTSKLSRFRLSDNYVRFYLKYIKPNQEKIKTGAFNFSGFKSLRGWDAIVGFQFENLVLANRSLILDELEIDRAEIDAEGSFFQTQTQRQKGCQIDYMVQTRFKNLYACECKFSSGRPIGPWVIDEHQKKLFHLSTPRHTSIRPVLIYAGEIEPGLDDYFYKIIDFGKFLELK